MIRLPVVATTALLLAAIVAAPAHGLPYPLVLTQSSAGRQAVARVDPDTLRPRGRSTVLPAAAYAVETAPDGRRLALLTVYENRDGGDLDYGVSIVGTRSARRLGSVRLGKRSIPTGMAWIGKDRLLVTGESPPAIVVDTARRRVVRRFHLAGEPVATAQVGDAVAVVMRPEAADGTIDATAAPVIQLVDGDGRTLRRLTVPQVAPPPDDEFGIDLEVDPVTGALLVVRDGASPQLSAVDPATGAGAVRQLPRDGTGGEVTWRGPRTLVTTRADGATTVRRLDGGGGVTLTQTLPEGAAVSPDGSVSVARGVVSAVDGRWQRRVGGAIAAATVGDRVIVQVGERRPRAAVLDAATGRVIARPRPPRGTRIVSRDSDGGRGATERGAEPLFVAP